MWGGGSLWKVQDMGWGRRPANTRLGRRAGLERPLWEAGTLPGPLGPRVSPHSWVTDKSLPCRWKPCQAFTAQ